MDHVSLIERTNDIECTIKMSNGSHFIVEAALAQVVVELWYKIAGNPALNGVFVVAKNKEGVYGYKKVG